MLLAYYIAAINIEAAFHDSYDGGYHPFEGIVLTDTFQMGERLQSSDDIYFPKNNDRAAKQKAADIQVIVGNPPYSVGQGSENDDNKNLTYPTLDDAIRQSYAARSTAGLKRNLYDSYIRAFRWASDRIGDRGVICFVSNGSFIDSGSADGFRKSLMDEFSAIYCFNLRGNQRTSGETSRREGGKVFGSGSRTPVAITLLVKNPDKQGPCQLHYRDIGDYLSREQKLEIVGEAGSIEGVQWDLVLPDSSGDWINLRDALFQSFPPLGDKRGNAADPLFGVYSLGVVTNRDAWAYNFSRSRLVATMQETIEFYNEQLADFSFWSELNGGRSAEGVDAFIDRDPAKISWTRALKGDLRKDKPASFDANRVVQSMYRPFCKQWLYFDRQWNEQVQLMPKLFPSPAHGNLAIAISGVGAGAGYSVQITDVIPCLSMAGAGNAVQCFPMYQYVPSQGDGTLFSTEVVVDGLRRHEAITDHTLGCYQARYGIELSKEDIFYYVYGLLHAPEYCTRFASDLGKMIPRIPMAEDFMAFSNAGRQLAEWHLNYETVDPWPLEGLPDVGTDPHDLRVTKMSFGKVNKSPDKSTIVANPHVVLRGIPDEAYEYEVNGKSALAWIMDRYQVKTDKDSGIINDPNAWSDDPRYVVDLVARIVRVSVESAQIVKGLPPLGI